ncbi:MAG: HAMP domain-containing sensor histidine kinase [Candidatus Riflebacteria bacterium]|jgi:two-component system sensor histidine kinase CpxA|nr:HAMP domain-containing sensor histidine kinase [Candidatus Riflebacteria bacterium]
MSDRKTKISAPPLHSTFYGSKLFLKFFFWVWLTLIVTGIMVAMYGYFYHFEPEKQRLFNMGREMIEENGQMLVNAYEKLGVESAANFRLPGSFWLFDTDLNILFSGIHKPLRNRDHQKIDALAPDKEKIDPAGAKTPDINFSQMPDSGSEPKTHEMNAASPPFKMSDRGQRSGGSTTWFREKYARLFKDKHEEIKLYATHLLKSGIAGSETVAGELLLGAAITSESGQKYALICHLPNRIPNHAHFLLLRVVENLPIFLLATGLLCLWLARYTIKPIIELRTASHSFARGNLKTRITGKAIDRFDEIGDLAADFNDMAEKIEKLIGSQRRLFSDISHELRSPLARLQLSLELLQKKSSDADQQMLARIGREISRMNALIEELLQFSKLESGEVGGTTRAISLQSILKRVCNDAGFEGRSRNCSVRLLTDEDITISGIPNLIERAIENILRNAVKFSPKDSEVTLKLQRSGSDAQITITDRGPGIPEEELQKVFAPFYCLSEDRNPQKNGIGLGLAIAQRAIKFHNGQITLKNNPDGGLIATVTLPIAA